MRAPLRFAVTALCSIAAACGGDDAPPPGLDCAAPEEEGLLVGPSCPGLALRLRPGVRVGGAWRGFGQDGACVPDGADRLTCPAGDVGDVTVERDGATVLARFVARTDVVVEGLALQGPASVEGARAWISNGFHSWSQSGAVAIGPTLGEEALSDALAARGDAEVVREGHELSWTYTLIGSTADADALLAGAITADRWKPWVTVAREDEATLRVRLGSGGTGEAVALAAGEAVDGERFHVGGGSPQAQLEAYAAALPSRHRERPAVPEAGWNSWYDLWDAVDEGAVRENAALAKAILEPRVPAATPLRIVVDDGWQRAWGDWQPNEKFPTGLDGLAADLRADGFEMGVWLAPLLVHEEAPVAVDHPDWLVEGPSYRHLKNGSMRVLDVTHPDAAAHLADVIGTIVSWGYTLLKIDFLFVGTWEGGRHEEVTGLQAYRRALEIIRDAAGAEVLLLAVGAPGLASLPHVDQWRVGGDIALENFGAAWPFIPNQARSVGARLPFCLATLCDADPVLLRDLPRNEVEVGAWTVALAGGGLFLSDDLRAVDAARAAWALDAPRVTLALSAAPASPEDVLPDAAPQRLASALGDHLGGRRGSTHVLPTRWQLQDGSTLLLNVTDDPQTLADTEVPPRTALHQP